MKYCIVATFGGSCAKRIKHLRYSFAIFIFRDTLLEIPNKFQPPRGKRGPSVRGTWRGRKGCYKVSLISRLLMLSKTFMQNEYMKRPTYVRYVWWVATVKRCKIIDYACFSGSADNCLTQRVQKQLPVRIRYWHRVHVCVRTVCVWVCTYMYVQDLQRAMIW